MTSILLLIFPRLKNTSENCWQWRKTGRANTTQNLISSERFFQENFLQVVGLQPFLKCRQTQAFFFDRSDQSDCSVGEPNKPARTVACNPIPQSENAKQKIPYYSSPTSCFPKNLSQKTRSWLIVAGKGY